MIWTIENVPCGRVFLISVFVSPFIIIRYFRDEGQLNSSAGFLSYFLKASMLSDMVDSFLRCQPVVLILIQS